MNKVAKGLLSFASAFSFLFASAACQSEAAQEVETDVDNAAETAKEDIEGTVEDAKEDIEGAAETAKEDIEGAENDVKDSVEEAVNTVDEKVGTDTSISILEQEDGRLIIEALSDQDSIIDALEALKEDGKITYATVETDGGLDVDMIDDVTAEGDMAWKLYTSVNEYDGQELTDLMQSIEYDGKDCGMATVPASDVPFVATNYYLFVLE